MSVGCGDSAQSLGFLCGGGWRAVRTGDRRARGDAGNQAERDPDERDEDHAEDRAPRVRSRAIATGPAIANASGTPGTTATMKASWAPAYCQPAPIRPGRAAMAAAPRTSGESRRSNASPANSVAATIHAYISAVGGPKWVVRASRLPMRYTQRRPSGQISWDPPDVAPSGSDPKSLHASLAAGSTVRPGHCRRGCRPPAPREADQGAAGHRARTLRWTSPTAFAGVACGCCRAGVRQHCGFEGESVS